MLRFLAGLLCALFVAPPASPARDLYVDLQGRDSNPGTEAAPLATIQLAVKQARPGDVIHLGPPGAVFRQSVTFTGATNLTLDGHGSTLDGSDPLPTDGWETVGEGLRRLRIRRTQWDRHLLTFDGRTEHMGRTQSNTTKPFLKPEELHDGQFGVVNIDDRDAWLYVRGAVKQLEWSTRVNGVATGGTNQGLVVKNLAARRFLNDGFNIHGHAYDLVFEKIDGYECFDEGFSAHEDCTCKITDGRFWGCENAIADVNDAQTDYLRCEFSRSLGADCLFTGKRHSLVDCKIVNAPGSIALTGGARGENATFELLLERVTISSAASAGKPRVRINNGVVTVKDCDFTAVDFNTTGAAVKPERAKLP
jgi:hypothetical protein